MQQLLNNLQSEKEDSNKSEKDYNSEKDSQLIEQPEKKVTNLVCYEKLKVLGKKYFQSILN